MPQAAGKKLIVWKELKHFKFIKAKGLTCQVVWKELKHFQFIKAKGLTCQEKANCLKKS